ncbi:cobalamin B12-binding domain-containing protein [Paraburkholderia aromaticivorans]|uniref:cobalamin B12-binding domain-containing protein n=1 Tax=Paraburkholderia aromaticivorans TaxID=2026199 RepID=UPI001F0E7FC7|nr:cobalamin B12-binding domain-containing protein [Paraburkholderia aromaticivorans]
MKVLAVHPSGLMYTRVFLRLEPLGLETVAAVLRAAAHEVRLLDSQVESHRDLERLIRKWRPDAVCFSGNYLANIPEIIDLSKAIKAQWPDCFVFVGGHSASFTAADMLRHYVHGPAGRKGRKGRKLDDATGSFVDETRMGTG